MSHDLNIKIIIVFTEYLHFIQLYTYVQFKYILFLFWEVLHHNLLINRHVSSITLPGLGIARQTSTS